MKLDVIIPCYNAKDTLFKTLSSIALQRNIEFVYNKYRYFNRLYEKASDKDKKYLYDLINKYDKKNIELIGISKKKEFTNKLIDIYKYEYIRYK